MSIQYLKTYFRFWFGAVWAAVGTVFLVVFATLARDEGRSGGEEGQISQGAATLAIGIGVLFAAIGFALVFSAVRQSGRRAALVRSGTVATGTVVGLETIQNLRINQRNPVYLRVAYKDELGHAHQVDSACLPVKLLHRWQSGDPIRVVYDPFQPARCEVDIFDARAT